MSELLAVLAVIVVGRLGWRLFKGMCRVAWWAFTTFLGAVAFVLLLAAFGSQC